MFGFSTQTHGDIDEQGSGIRSGMGDQGYVDIANPPPPPLPQVSTGDDWSNPYVNAPPMVGAVPANDTSWDTWFGRGKSVVTGLVDIFGRQVTPTGQPVVVQSQGMPLWGWVLVGIGGVAVVGFAARSLRRPALAGYRRRSRRSRR